MQRSKSSLLARHDTFFGVCEAIGQDFGINAIYLRLGFAVGLLFNPVVALASYFGLGVIVMASRWIAPQHSIEADPARNIAAAPLKGDNDAERVELVAAA